MSSIAISSILVVLSIVAIIYLTSKVKFSVFGSLFAVSLALVGVGALVVRRRRASAAAPPTPA